MKKQVVVALDGSSLAERALGPAQEIAERWDASIHLIRVVPDFVPFETGHDVLRHPWTDGEQAEAAAYLAKTAGQLKGTVETSEPIGETVSVLLKEAESADLLILTSHGRSGFARFFLGSVTEKVIRHTPAPVLVVRSGPFHLAQVRRIMLCLDGSEFAEQSIDMACYFARETSAELVLSRILEEERLNRSGAELDERKQEALKAAGSYLERLGERLPEGTQYSCSCDFGSPARSITRLAQSLNIDLIVMNTHGRSGLKRLMCGSVAENVVRCSEVPVLLVPRR